MPLRDHFHPPLSERSLWDALHGQWPAMIVLDLNKRLPPSYVAAPRVHLGTAFEVDIAAHERDAYEPLSTGIAGSNGGAVTATWAPPEPTLAVATDLPEQDEYEVRVHETEQHRLVAVIEIVSPSNKDRPENRRTFVAKCAALLQQGVSVSIVDLVTVRQFNLYADLIDLLGQTDPALSPEPPPLYAGACRYREAHPREWRFETWTHAMRVGQPLPTLPLWLSETFALPLDLESSYEETCRVLRIV